MVWERGLGPRWALSGLGAKKGGYPAGDGRPFGSAIRHRFLASRALVVPQTPPGPGGLAFSREILPPYLCRCVPGPPDVVCWSSLVLTAGRSGSCGGRS